MSWKERIQIDDLSVQTKIEVTCKKCGRFHYVDVSTLQPRHPVLYKFLDQFEECQICPVWGCGGACRVALPPESDREGFQGGLA